MRNFPSLPFTRGAANRDLEQEALEWVVRLTSGEVTAEDQAAFAEWHGDPANAAAYARAAKMWQGLGPILASHDIDAAPESSTLRTTRSANDNGWSARWAGIAAVLTVALLCSYQYARVWQFDHVSPSARHDVATTLEDGSQVTLGPDTAFDVRFEGGRRSVHLARGEAFFDVTHDPARPFVVEAAGGTVQVLGTAFSMRARDDGSVDVVVARGRVSVRRGAHVAMLTPDRGVRFSPTTFGPVRALDASLATAWTRGRLIMENRPLADVLTELDRYSSKSIILMNEAAGDRRVNVVIDLDRIDGWLTALGASQGLEIDSLGPVVLVR